MVLIMSPEFFARRQTKMYQALYRKYRPTTFNDVVGQEHITTILQSEVRLNKISHAYLFCGSRGTGKTTCAKILAKVANCEHPVNGNPCNKCPACVEIDSGSAYDILEMDAASNRGIDDIRSIRDEVGTAPISLKNRVYIIDEVHMLTTEAFNALLKTLEEPPENVIFILATTESHKLPATIVSRCQRFDFRRIASDIISNQLAKIAKLENIKLTDEASFMIARLSQGGMRDAISLLELCTGGSAIVDKEKVEATSGSTGRGTTEKTIEAIAKKDSATLFEIIAELYSGAKDISVFWTELLAFYRDMMAIKSLKLDTDHLRKRILDLTIDEFNNLKKISDFFTMETLLYHSKVLEDAYISISRGIEDKRGRAEMTLMRLTLPPIDDNIESLIARISNLEQKLNGENFYQTPTYSSKISQEPSKPQPMPSMQSKNPKDYWNNVISNLMDATLLQDSIIQKEGDTLKIIVDSFSYDLLDRAVDEKEILLLIPRFDIDIKNVKIISA